LKRTKKEEENKKTLGEKIRKRRSGRMRGRDVTKENDNTRRRKKGEWGEMV
jgi:hypothetical protein